jgi:2'-5' RNA ligase superfamily
MQHQVVIDCNKLPRQTSGLLQQTREDIMNALAQDKLVAIDVLLKPDQRMLTAADEWNKRLREQMPGGFSLDETHCPHITLLQQYVAEKDLDAVVAMVKSLAATANLEKMKLTAKGLYHIPGGKIGLQGITIKPSDEILALQTKVIQAMAPFRKSGGDQVAFVPDPTGMPFDPLLFKYVDSFVEKQAGKNYNPHVTTGTAHLEEAQSCSEIPACRGPEVLSILVEVDPITGKMSEEYPKDYPERVEKFCRNYIWRKVTGDITVEFLEAAVDRMFTADEVACVVDLARLKRLKCQIGGLFFTRCASKNSKTATFLSRKNCL